MIRNWIFITLLVAFGGLLLWNFSLRMQNDALQLEVRVLLGELQENKLRIQNLKEDKQSDETVTDPRSFPVPNRWLLPQAD